MRRRKIAGVLIPAAVSAALLLLLMRGSSWSDLGRSIGGIPRSALAVYALASGAGLVLRAVRFRLLLPRPRPGAVPILLVTMVQHCLGDLVPGRLAALGSYVYLLVHRLGVGLEPAAATFLLSFVFELATLGPVLALAALVRLDAGPGPLASGLPLGWIVAAGTLFFLAAAAALFELGPITRAVSRVVRGNAAAAAAGANDRRQRLAARLDTLAAATAEARSAGTLVPVFLISMVIRLAKYVSLYALMTGLLAGAAGRQPDFWDLILGITATELIAGLPIPALGQFGVWEGGLTGALVLLGLERGTAAVVAVGMHAIAQGYEYLLGIVALGILAVTGARIEEGQAEGNAKAWRSAPGAAAAQPAGGEQGRQAPGQLDEQLTQVRRAEDIRAIDAREDFECGVKRLRAPGPEDREADRRLAVDHEHVEQQVREAGSGEKQPGP
jgi:uncharacterized membrane protein YbhN (UPF0104 family)